MSLKTVSLNKLLFLTLTCFILCLPVKGYAVVLGLGDTVKYSLVASGETLQVPEGATGCNIWNVGIRGTLDLDEAIGDDTLGSELITNGDFGAALGAEWDLTVGGGGGSIAIVAGELKFTQGTSVGMYASQDFTTVIGTLYKFATNIKTISTSSWAKLMVGISQNGVQIYDSGYYTTTGIKTIYFTATATTTWITILDAQTDLATSTWDDVSVKEVTSTDGIYNTWATAVDLAGIGAGEIVRFYNSGFIQSEATIRATLGASGTAMFDADCQFSIGTTGFRNYASDNFILTAGSALRNAGDNTPHDGTADVTDLAGRAITDGSGNIIAPGGIVDIGPYEWHLSGNMGMGMGLKGGFCPYRPDED